MTNVNTFADISVDTRDRISGVPENCVIQFSVSNIAIKQLRLTEIEIPVSYYNIKNINTGFLTIDFDELDGSGEKSAVIPAAPLASGKIVGYTLSEFLTAATLAMNTASASADHTYAITHDTGTDKITIANTAVGTAPFAILFQSGTNKLSKIGSLLGYSNTENLIRQSSYVAPNTLNIDVNNIIDITESGTPIAVKMAVGSYTGPEFTTAIAAELDAASAASGDTLTYTVTLDSITNKMTISATGAFDLDFATGPNSYITNIPPTIGFARTDVSTASSYTGTDVVNFAFENYIYLKSSTALGVDQGIIVGNTTDRNTIARIPISEPTDGIMFYTNTSEFEVDINNPLDINSIDFQITFRNDQPVDFNGHNWSAKMRVLY